MARKHHPPRELIPDGPNQVWSWDISYLPTTDRGQFYYLYLFVDTWSRKIKRAEVHLRESGNIAARMLRDACNEHGISENILVLHSDNGSPMKAATMLATMQRSESLRRSADRASATTIPSRRPSFTP